MLCRKKRFAAYLSLIVILASEQATAVDTFEWSPFAPLSMPEVPQIVVGGEGAVDTSVWSDSAIDRFVLTALLRKRLTPAPEVDPGAWLRRVTLNLTGLPPTPEEMSSFLEETRPPAVRREAVVDRLLSSPRYGERWARHWLDVVRYADSDGFAIDGERYTLWRFRDYVVRSLNTDKPFDQFVREQIAGDELEGLGSDGIIATGFYRLGPFEADNMVRAVKRQDYLNEITSTVGSAFLGLTFGCARCHDHKYDPVSIEDYYRLQAFFSPIRRVDRTAPWVTERGVESLLARRQKAEREGERRREELKAWRTTLRAQLAKTTNKSPMDIKDAELDKALTDGKFSKEQKDRHAALKKAVDDYKDAGRYADIACAIANPAEDKALPSTFVLAGGDVRRPEGKVNPGFPAHIPEWSDELFARLSALEKKASGRRRVLAHWLADPRNPLTPRVIVNRVWKYHFGVGIVATPNDFGVNGSGPSHPELLDYLATQLIRNRWSLKSLHREIALSRAYRTSLEHADFERHAEVDPENRLLWRGHHRRLAAEEIRDALLAVSGSLNLEQGGPGFYEELPAELGVQFPFFTWNPSSLSQRQRRSVYMFQRRNMVFPMFAAFDVADMTEPCGRRQSSVTTPQVFSLFNSQLVYRVCETFARRVLSESSDREEQVRAIYQLAYCREPTADEILWAREFLTTEPQKQLERLADYCLVVVNSNEFLYPE